MLATISKLYTLYNTAPIDPETSSRTAGVETLRARHPQPNLRIIAAAMVAVLLRMKLRMSLSKRVSTDGSFVTACRSLAGQEAHSVRPSAHTVEGMRRAVPASTR